MSYTNEELEIIEGIRYIKGCEDYTEDECLEVWVFAMELERRLDLD